MPLKTLMDSFLAGEDGQDLIEYTLLLAFIALASAALYLNVSQTINGIWRGISSRLAS